MLSVKRVILIGYEKKSKALKIGLKFLLLSIFQNVFRLSLFLAKYEPSDIMGNSCVTHGSVPK